MGRYIDWYLVEVERRLDRTLPREKVHETLLEVESHLDSAKAGAMATGLREREAELAAIEAFGTPAQFARIGTPQQVARWQAVAPWMAVLCGVFWAVLMPVALLTNSPGLPLWIILLSAITFALCMARCAPLPPLRLAGIGVCAGLVHWVLMAMWFVPLESRSATAFTPRDMRATSMDVSYWDSAVFFVPQVAEATALAIVVLLGINWIAPLVGGQLQRLKPSRRVMS